MSKIYFVTGIATDIGKTFLVENLCRNLRRKKIAVNAIKPIASGFLDQDENSDSAKILAALGLEFSKKNLDLVTPWRFAQSCSPHHAAKIEGKEINFLELKSFCEKKILEAKNSQEVLLIEAAGGVMTPINDEKTFLDLAAELQIPTLLISANYLGAISHTLCALQALKSKKIRLEKIIVNENLLSFQKDSLMEITETVQAIQKFTEVEVASLKAFLDKD